MLQEDLPQERTRLVKPLVVSIMFQEPTTSSFQRFAVFRDQGSGRTTTAPSFASASAMLLHSI
jgi:hypothetical protein